MLLSWFIQIGCFVVMCVLFARESNQYSNVLVSSREHYTTVE